MPKCKACRQPFGRMRPMQRACSPACALELAKADRERKAKREAVADRRETRAKLLELKPLSWHKARTQDACNAYVRRRDAGKPCICCGATTVGEPVDAGHFLSRGAAPELRFDLGNIHIQLRGCNRGRTVPPRARFRAHMIDRIGPDRLAAIEGPHPPRKWTREELAALRAEFTRMSRALEAA